MTKAECEALSKIRERAEASLRENLLPFWAVHSWDQEHGGFLTRLDRRGRRLEDHEKILIMQVRMIGSLSAAHRFGIPEHGYLDMAAQGFDFVVKHFWDSQQGGFYYSVTRKGAAKCTRKNTDFHAYAITGFTEYYRASGRREALDWAVRVFDLLQTQAADGDKGYVEDFDGADWPALNSEQMDLGDQRRIKTIDMHVNMLEALQYLCRITGDPGHLSALRKVLRLISERGIHPEHGCTITAFDEHWNPVTDAAGKVTTSYGINVELAWIMLAAVEVLGEPREVYRSQVLGLIDHALDFGFDHERGGVAAYGPLTGHVTLATDLKPERLLRAWWEQAEMLIAIIEAFRWTEDRKYLDAFFSLFDWVWRFQIDHECGDWYQDLRWPSGEPVTTDKGQEWKTSFHAGRALIHVANAARSLIESPL